MTVHPEVAEALAAGRPVVALESTIISHGMPYPENEAMAREVEGIVRAGGAVPATIAVIDGECLVGLTEDQLHQLATVSGVYKATTRDLPWLLAAGATGATTVAATMKLASMAGIRVFATGGIGGVHRGATTSMDISADLTEMAVTPVAVVSAGVKSILDIRLTLEHLETLGVPVVVNGSDDFPSFFSRTSGLPAPRRLDGQAAIARMTNGSFPKARVHTWTALHRDNEFAQRFFGNLFPGYRVEQSTLDKAQAVLDANGDRLPTLRRQLMEAIDDLKRAIACREFAAS